jgi:CRP/FNR family transcriptional regulator, nitrogen oxide reductase regulator
VIVEKIRASRPKSVSSGSADGDGSFRSSSDPDLLIANLRKAELFAGLSDEALREVRAAGRLRRFAAGAWLFRQEQPATTFYIVLAGRVRVSEITVEGHTVLLRFIEPGQMLGAMAVLENMTYPVNAEAAEPVSALSWSTQGMNRLMDRHPRIARNAMRLMVDRIRELQQRCVELATERVEQRVARTLLRLLRQVGQRTEEGVELRLRLSRQDIAEMTGTTLFTVSRILTRWQEEGIVKIGRQRVVIRQPHALVGIGEGG